MTDNRPDPYFPRVNRGGSWPVTDPAWVRANDRHENRRADAPEYCTARSGFRTALPGRMKR